MDRMQRKRRGDGDHGPYQNEEAGQRQLLLVDYQV
jgi:hypothetical protein